MTISLVSVNCPFGTAGPHPTPPVQDDGLVRVSAGALIALHHGAESLPLRPRAIRSARSGTYLSPFKGGGMEFDEVRPYQQGDDARTLDWRVTARTGRPHTKLFREERERAVLLWVDLRHTMHFATRGAFKAVRAAQAAALLGWSAVQHGDRLGGLLFAEGFHRELPPRRGRTTLLHLLERLADAPVWTSSHDKSAVDPAATLADALTRLRRVAQPGSLIFLLSDFHALDALTEAHLVQLSRHNDLVLVQVYDPLEAELPPPGRYRVSNGHTILAFDADSNAARRCYHDAFTARCTALTTLCRSHGMHHLSLATDDDPLAALQRGLGRNRCL
ncbi:DUF58 domain-containing protein [Gammaproteobacteria bacterium]